MWRIVCSILFSEGTENISLYGKLAFISAVIAILFYVLALVCSHLAAFRIASNIRVKLLRHISLLPLGVIDELGTGHLRRIIIDTSGAAETYLAHHLPDKYGALSLTLGLLVLLFLQDWRIALVSLAPIVLGFIVMSFMTGESMRRKIAEYQNALNLMSNEAVEYIRGMPVVKTFGQSVYTFRRFQKAIMNYEAWTTAYTNELRMPMMCFTLAVNGSFFFLIAAGVFVSVNYGVSREFLANFALAVIIAPLISVTLMRTMRQNENAMLSADALKRIHEIFSMKPLPVPETFSTPGNYGVDVDSVSFSYGRKSSALTDITLSIKPGETLALVGRSGGGKSTLAKLIARFFDAGKGRISIGGVDVKNCDVMKYIAFVFQDSKLIRGTILDNLRMSKPGASHEEILAALNAAGCDDIIAKYPLDAQISHLSGGEAQRITIARAFLKDSPIIIMDEAVAFADPDNEHKINSALSRLAEHKTVIMIAHRLSSVCGADVIAVLDGGKLAEKGTFDELMSRNGIFAEMWKEYNTSLTWNITKGDKK